MKKEEENKGQQGSCKSCLPCFIAVVLDFDQRLLGNKDKTNNKKEMGKIRHFNIWGPKPPGPKWKRAETSGGQIRKGRNLWQPTQKSSDHVKILIKGTF